MGFIELIQDKNNPLAFYKHVCRDWQKVKFLDDFFQNEKSDSIKENILSLAAIQLNSVMEKYKNEPHEKVIITEIQKFLDKNQPSPVLSM